MVEFAGDKKASPEPAVSFGEIVGQAELKEALLAVAVHDGLDGLLIQGEKGTAKSTAVRGLVDLLPAQRAVADCPYGCPPDRPADQCVECRERSDPTIEQRPVPLVTLPLGATRDRVVGTLSVADALDGEPSFDPGLLARANRGILYVDEVNLLDDHLVDVLLDAAASGVNRVERDGVSVSHPANVTLVGTMNPEEGSLRPQLRDRFALQVTVTGCTDVDRRVAIIDRALDGDEQDHESPTTTADHRRQLERATERLDDVTLPGEFKREIADLCLDAGVDGHRGDIAIARAAMAFAALDDRPKVLESDVRRAAHLALPHRLQSTPFEETPDPQDVIDERFDDVESKADGKTENDGERNDERGEKENDERGEKENNERGEKENDEDGRGCEQRHADRRMESESDGSSAGSDAGEDSEGDTATPLLPGQSRADVGAGTAPEIEPPDVTAGDDGDGTRTSAQPAPDNEGPRIRTERASEPGHVDPGASLRAVARRGGEDVESRDLRQSVRAGAASTLVLFVVDASASMRGPMRAAKGVVLELLQDAYENRDQVGLVAFAGDDADVLLPPTDSVDLAARHLKELPVGDRTPLSAGLRTAARVVDSAEHDTAVVVLVTDGRANAGSERPTAGTRRAAAELAERDVSLLAVDASDGDRDRGHANLFEDVVATTGGQRVPLSALSAERVDRFAAAGTDGSSTATDPKDARQ